MKLKTMKILLTKPGNPVGNNVVTKTNSSGVKHGIQNTLVKKDFAARDNNCPTECLSQFSCSGELKTDTVNNIVNGANGFNQGSDSALLPEVRQARRDLHEKGWLGCGSSKCPPVGLSSFMTNKRLKTNQQMAIQNLKRILTGAY